MKTFNINMKSVVIVALSFIATSVNVNAQDQKKYTPEEEAWIQEQKTGLALVVGAEKKSANDVEWSNVIVKDGYITDVDVERHISLAIGASAGDSFISGSSEDKGSQSSSCGTFDLTAEYKYYHCRKDKDGKNHDAVAGLYLGLTAEINTKTTIENLSTQAVAAYLDLGTVFNPCGKLQTTVALTGGYRNSTSQRYISNDVVEGNIDFKSNPWYLGGMLKISYPLFYRRKTKDHMVKGQKITSHTKTPVEVFVKSRIGFTSISKPKVDNKTFTWDGSCISILAGIAVGL